VLFDDSYYIGNIIMFVHNNTVKSKILPEHSMNVSMGAGVIILNLSNWWSWVVSFMSQLHKPLTHLSRRRGGPQGQTWHFCRTAIFLAHAGNQTMDQPAPSPVIIPKTISRLLNNKK